MGAGQEFDRVVTLPKWSLVTVSSTDQLILSTSVAMANVNSRASPLTCVGP